MKVINYRVTLLEPTLVTSLQGDPNSAVAFDYLPGSVLRGVLIGKYLEYLGSKSVDTSDSTLRRLFFDGTTRYLSLCPGSEKRTMKTISSILPLQCRMTRSNGSRSQCRSTLSLAKMCG